MARKRLRLGISAKAAGGRAMLLRQEAVAKRVRRLKVRDLLLQGCSSQSEMAARIGCSQATISKDIAAIFKEWLVEDVETSHAKAAYRVRQLELGASQSFDAFQRSKQSVEQVTTEYEKVLCPSCAGKGRNGKGCKTCDGTGAVVQENVTRRMTGQAGDPSHMSNYRAFIREMAKIEGLYQKKPDDDKPTGDVYHQHLHLKIDWDKVPADQLLRIRSECRKLMVYGKTIDAESKPEGER